MVHICALCPVLIKKMQAPQTDKTGLLAGGASTQYERFAAGKASAQAEFISAEHINQKGGAALWAAEPKKEDTTCVVSFFLVTRRRFELRTHCLKGSCSAD